MLEEIMEVMRANLENLIKDMEGKLVLIDFDGIVTNSVPTSRGGLGSKNVLATRATTGLLETLKNTYGNNLFLVTYGTPSVREERRKYAIDKASMAASRVYALSNTSEVTRFIEELNNRDNRGMVYLSYDADLIEAVKTKCPYVKGFHMSQLYSK